MKKVVVSNKTSKVIECQMANLELYRMVQSVVVECLGERRGQKVLEERIAPLNESMYEELRKLLDDLIFDGINSSESSQEICI